MNSVIVETFSPCLKEKDLAMMRGQPTGMVSTKPWMLTRKGVLI